MTKFLTESGVNAAGMYEAKGFTCRRPQDIRCPQESFPPLITSYILLAGRVVGDGDRWGAEAG